jgi:hypothetical protein
MHCEVLKDNEGRPIAVVCGLRRARRRMCRFCNHDFVRKLCDFPVGPRGETCDRGMCDKCATSAGRDRDHCPDHAGKKPAAEQGMLFGA